MADLTGFLLARIAEDEGRDIHALGCPYGSSLGVDDCACRQPARVLAECEAKRRIVQRHSKCGTGTGYCDDGGHGWGFEGEANCADMADLALPYADHSDYREEWRP